MVHAGLRDSAGGKKKLNAIEKSMKNTNNSGSHIRLTHVQE